MPEPLSADRWDRVLFDRSWLGLAFLTGGEGLHNNHHAAPTAARLSFRRGEIDPAWPVLRLFRRLGWATVRHERAPVRVPVGVG